MVSPTPLEPLLTSQQAADYLNVPLSTWYYLRSQGDSHPPAIRVGKHLRYRKSDLDVWLDSQTERPVRSATA